MNMLLKNFTKSILREVSLISLLLHLSPTLTPCSYPTSLFLGRFLPMFIFMKKSHKFVFLHKREHACRETNPPDLPRTENFSWDIELLVLKLGESGKLGGVGHSIYTLFKKKNY